MGHVAAIVFLIDNFFLFFGVACFLNCFFLLKSLND